MSEKVKPHLAFSIDFEGFVEGMEESFEIPAHIMRYDIFDELNSNLEYCLEFLNENKIEATFFILGWIGEKYPELIHYNFFDNLRGKLRDPDVFQPASLFQPASSLFESVLLQAGRHVPIFEKYFQE